MTNVLATGGELHPGDQMTSANGAYHLVLQRDGNLVLYGPYRAAWETATTTGALLVAQSDGNVVLYDGSRKPLWATTTTGSTELVLQDDGNLVVYQITAVPHWQSGTGVQYPNVVNAGCKLTAGNGMQSPSGAYHLFVQHDGNLVLYGPSGPVWQSGTFVGDGCTLIMQGDGNLVLYKPDGTPVWATGTRSGDRVVLQDDGNLVVYAGPQAQPTWSVATAAAPFAGVTRTVSPDVSEFQPPADMSMDKPWFIFRESDGDYIDHNFGTNLAVAKQLSAAGRIAGYCAYHVYEPAPVATQRARAERLVGHLDGHGVPEIDVETWGGKITGDHSGLINSYRGRCQELLSSTRNVVYGNWGDLSAVYPNRPSGTALIVAAYGPNLPTHPDQLGVQYTDGQLSWGLPPGLPAATPPFGACDHQVFEMTPPQLATRLGV